MPAQKAGGPSSSMHVAEWSTHAFRRKRRFALTGPICSKRQRRENSAVATTEVFVRSNPRLPWARASQPWSFCCGNVFFFVTAVSL